MRIFNKKDEPYTSYLFRKRLNLFTKKICKMIEQYNFTRNGIRDDKTIWNVLTYV